jgi:hypothetical protein
MTFLDRLEQQCPRWLLGLGLAAVAIFWFTS